LYGSRAYVPKAYAAEVKSMMQLLQSRYGLSARESTSDHENTTPELPAQRDFDWSEGG
jgi:hypothetical protein